MGATAENFRDLVRKAHDGELKLPGFQRTFRWKPDKVIKLYDSLRLRYPIGSFLFLAGSGGTLSPRVFNGSIESAATSQTTFLVLDGQQRLTSGVHIFYATGKRQYYIDLNRLLELTNEHKVDFKDEQSVLNFCRSIDYEDGYLIARPSVDDARALFIQRHLLCTSVITNSLSFNISSHDYLQKYPDRFDFINRMVQPHFSLQSSDFVPYSSIDGDTSISAISRIFTTLNTTGQMLTPFELVVASLFPFKIDLQSEVKDFRELGEFYSQMDRTGEILLQTIAMLAGSEPKKSNLPKTINESNYQQYKDEAFKALDNLGRFLTDNLGCGLNATGNLVPYDAIYAPMAKAYLHVISKSLTGPDLAEAHKKLKLWFAASSLSQRYQEGVHNKQVRDFREIVAWIDGGAKPDWIGEATTPSLLNKSFDGAIGKFIQCCINQRAPRDPVVDAYKVGFGAGTMPTEKHHIYPSKFVQHLSGWDKKADKSDTLLNMMFVERTTNRDWLNANPLDHIKQAAKSLSDSKIEENYRRQFIYADALDLLKRPEKTRSEFYEFLTLRQQALRQWIHEEFGIPPHAAGAEADDDELALDEELVEAVS